MPDISLFDAIGGDDALLRLAHAWHERVLADEVVAHAFRGPVLESIPRPFGHSEVRPGRRPCCSGTSPKQSRLPKRYAGTTSMMSDPCT